MLPINISTLFAKALEKSKHISGQPRDSHLEELREVLTQILLVIPYNEENRIHNIIRLIKYTTTYAAGYTAVFPCPQKPKIYNMFVRDNKKAPVRSRKESIHKAQLRDYTTYEAAEQETRELITGVVEDTWVRKVKRAKTLYTLVTAWKLAPHLQVTCGGLYALGVLKLKNNMQQYQLNSEGTPKYIKNIEDNQAKAERANNPITDATLVIIVTNAMLIMKKLPCANED